jgi:predicted heme/steroid binding protein
MTSERAFTPLELRRFDGERGHPAYVAFRGVVYDVSAMKRWRGGFHETLHFAGQDLTRYLADAPHGEEVFRRPGVVIVGRLQDPEEKQIDRPGLDGPAPGP